MSRNPMLALRMAQMMERMTGGDWPGARRRAEQIIAKHPERVSVRLTYARLIAEADPWRALEQVRTAVSLAPTDPDVLTRAALVTAYLVGGGTANASLFRGYVERARAFASSGISFPATLANLEGRVADLDGRVADAEAAFRQSIDICRKAQSLGGRSEHDPVYVQAVYELGEHPPGLIADLARFLARRQGPSAACAVVAKALDEFPDNVALRSLRDELAGRSRPRD